MKASFGTFAIAALSCLGMFTSGSTCNAVGTASLVVMSANPNGVPTVGNQYLLGVQIAGISQPTFLGTDMIVFSGALTNTNSPGTPSGNLYASPKVLFQSEADLANTNDAANYQRRNDSYFASPWTVLPNLANAATETSTTLTLDGGIFGALPSKVPSNGTYAFAYVDVTGAAGVSITGRFAVGTDPSPIGNGDGLKLTLDGQLLPLVQVSGDYNGNGVVDAADYVLWRNSGPLQNDPTAGVQAADYDFWRSRFGATAGGSALVGTAPVAIPEPSFIGLLAIAIWWNQRYQCGGWQGACGNT